jgi:hypothetical protein
MLLRQEFAIQVKSRHGRSLQTAVEPKSINFDPRAIKVGKKGANPVVKIPE